MPIVEILLALLVTLASAALSGFFGALAMKSGIVDAPDSNRKMQAAPVPLLGGAAIFGAAFIMSLICILVFGPGFGLTDASRTLATFVGVCFMVGLWDDLTDPPALAKLGVLVAACIAAPVLGLVPERMTTPFGDITATPVLIIGSALWLLVFTNGANFMDGSNGLTVGSLAFMFAGLAAASQPAGSIGLHYLWLILLGAMAGFLFHNLRGRLYAGDGGALGLGALFAGLGLATGLPVWTVATFALPFLVDVLLTLIWRTKHGRSLLKAHRDHTYQCLIKTGWSHMEVAVLYWGLSAVCAVSGVIGASAGGEAPFFVFWTLCLGLSSLWLAARRLSGGQHLQ